MIYCCNVKLHLLITNKGSQGGKGKSATTNFVSYKVTLLDVLKNGKHVDAVYTDFSAFDRVKHKILLMKLWSIGFHGSQSYNILHYISYFKLLSALLNKGDIITSELFRYE